MDFDWLHEEDTFYRALTQQKKFPCAATTIPSHGSCYLKDNIVFRERFKFSRETNIQIL